MRAEAEQQVYERLNMKIEEFLDLGGCKNTDCLLFFLCRSDVHILLVLD